jgi:hypothetical protein
LREVLLREWEIVQTAKEGVGDAWPLVANPRPANPKLDDEQRRALDALLSSINSVSVFRGGGNGATPVLMTSGALFGPTPLLGTQFDNANSGFVNLFPSKLMPGIGNTPAGSAGLGWVNGEVRQVNNLITYLLNGTAVAQYTNTSTYTNGTILIGYNDNFVSISDTNSFAVFDNIRVEPIVIGPVTLLSPQVAGNNFSFSFATDLYESYTVQKTTNLIAPTWLAYTNIMGNGSATITIPLTPGNSSAQYFRVSRP